MTIGATIGPYRVLAKLGEGRMGEGYRARDTKLGRDVALKVLPEILSHEPDRLARFKREARLLAALNHPNIAAIYGLEEAGGVPALVLELVDGPTLAALIAGAEAGPRALSIEDALPIARQIVEALEAAHEQAIVHRDLKPANIKVRPDGQVKVLDFGLAKALQDDPAGFRERLDIVADDHEPWGHTCWHDSGHGRVHEPRAGARTAGGQAHDGNPAHFALSPDGRLVGLLRRVDGETDIWLMETSRGVLRRLTSDTFAEAVPVWSPDGTRVAFDANRRGIRDLFLRSVGDTGTETVLLETAENLNASDWSPDGRFILHASLNASTARDLWALPLDGDRKPFAVVQTRYEEAGGRFSPDGRWIAYQSNESGRNEIYARPFPGPGASTQISTDGGTGALWSRGGREIVYLAADRRLMATTVATTDRNIDAGTPVALFPLQ